MLQRVVPGAVVDLPPLWHYMAGLRTPCEHLVRSLEIYPAYVADVVKGLLGWRVPHYSDIRGHSLADWAEWPRQAKVSECPAGRGAQGRHGEQSWTTSSGTCPDTLFVPCKGKVCTELGYGPGIARSQNAGSSSPLG